MIAAPPGVMGRPHLLAQEVYDASRYVPQRPRPRPYARAAHGRVGQAPGPTALAVLLLTSSGQPAVVMQDHV
jgi:hypothetical protein